MRVVRIVLRVTIIVALIFMCLHALNMLHANYIQRHMLASILPASNEHALEVKGMFDGEANAWEVVCWVSAGCLVAFVLMTICGEADGSRKRT
jgi:TRAP-type C4-dicarboxylate transport system permease small subunit